MVQNWIEVASALVQLPGGGQAARVQARIRDTKADAHREPRVTFAISDGSIIRALPIEPPVRQALDASGRVARLRSQTKVGSAVVTAASPPAPNAASAEVAMRVPSLEATEGLPVVTGAPASLVDTYSQLHSESLHAGPSLDASLIELTGFQVSGPTPVRHVTDIRTGPSGLESSYPGFDVSIDVTFTGPTVLFTGGGFINFECETNRPPPPQQGYEAPTPTGAPPGQPLSLEVRAWPSGLLERFMHTRRPVEFWACRSGGTCARPTGAWRLWALAHDRLTDSLRLPLPVVTNPVDSGRGNTESGWPMSMHGGGRGGFNPIESVLRPPPEPRWAFNAGTGALVWDSARTGDNVRPITLGGGQLHAHGGSSGSPSPYALHLLAYGPVGAPRTTLREGPSELPRRLGNPHRARSPRPPLRGRKR